MDNNELKLLINKFIAIDENKFDKGDLFIFKSLKNRNSTNPYINLKYEILNVDMAKSIVVDNTKRLLMYFLNDIFKDDTTLLEYHIDNPKKAFDYIELTQFDFSNSNIINGNLDATANPNHYKVQYLINEIKKTSAKIKKTNDFNTMRYTCSRVHIKDEEELHNIYIINKCKPLIKTKKAYYIYEPQDENLTSDRTEHSNFKIVEKDLFKMPFYPAMIIIDNLCLFIDDKIESIFGFEEYNKKICSDTLNDMKNNLILDDDSIENLTRLSNQKQYYNLFSDFDSSVLKSLYNDITNTNIEFIKDKLKISITRDNVSSKNIIKLDTKEKAIHYLKFICGHIKREATSDDIVAVNKSTPLNLS